MNKNVISIAIFAVLCTLAGVLVGAGITRKADLPWAGPQGRYSMDGPGHMMMRGPGDMKERRGDGMLQMLAERLGLDDAQKAKVKEIVEKASQDMNKVGEGVRSAIADIKEKSDKQIMAILTPGQQEKFKAMQEEFEKRCGPKGPGEDPRQMRRHDEHK